MLPLVLNPQHIKAGLVGRGAARDRRAALLAEAGVDAVILPDDAPDDALKPLTVLFVAGLGEGESRQLAGRARALGVLVNVEDVLPLCDFHVPALVRRGDLLLTASTGGQVPGLARALREVLAEQFGPEWTGRLKELSMARARWRSEGLSTGQVSENVRELLARMGWL
ncbi:MAG: siroheme synthase [Alphaproteobacteria bacterium]|nr:siroheme synthase [Alphaproteobacteria bacterium]